MNIQLQRIERLLAIYEGDAFLKHNYIAEVLPLRGNWTRNNACATVERATAWFGKILYVAIQGNHLNDEGNNEANYDGERTGFTWFIVKP